jgi:hypothetical protein
MPASINMLDDAEANSIHLRQLCDVIAGRELSEIAPYQRNNTGRTNSTTKQRGREERDT